MGTWLMRYGAIAIAVFTIVTTGCSQQQGDQSANSTPVEEPAAPVGATESVQPVEKAPVPIEVSTILEKLEPEPTSIPEVRLPETLEETCLVAVGDAMPNGEVATIDGERKPVVTMLGKAATVVFFWTAGTSEIAEKTAAMALADLQGDAQAVYGDKGLAVCAINHKDSSEKVKELLGGIKLSYPVLLDADGSYFAKVASAKLPRVYVLDATGKIVWFDVEFSEVSREGLKQTLKVMLGDRGSRK